MAISPELVRQIMELDADDLRTLNSIIVTELRSTRRRDNALAAMNFRLGEQVEFDGKPRGVVFRGTITKRNRTTFTVRTPYGIWRVPPSMLKKVEVPADGSR